MLSIKNMTAIRRWVPILIVFFAAVFRLLFLAMKPPHFDEGVNGWFLDEMVSQGYFAYNPSNYHGPLHFYLLFAFKVLLGRSVWALRLPVVIISILTVYLVTKFDRFLDRRTCWLAALAMAVSPGMEFYGRYAIHESEVVFFLILAVWGGAGLWRLGNNVKYLWALALGTTGMILTKETYIIHLVAFGLAAICLVILEKYLPIDPLQKEKRHIHVYAAWFFAIPAAVVFYYVLNFVFSSLLGQFESLSQYDITLYQKNFLAISPFLALAGAFATKAIMQDAPFQLPMRGCTARNLGWVLMVCISLVIFFYSGNLLNPSFYTTTQMLEFHSLGHDWVIRVPNFLIDTFCRPFEEWTKTGQNGNGHDKPAHYWLKLTMHYEWTVLIGMLASFFYIWPKSNRMLRFLMIYGWGTLVAYSIVHYKTPWCIITIMWPFFFLFGDFFKELLEEKSQKVAAACVVTLLLSGSFAWSVRLSFFRYTDEDEDYVYVQTTDDIYNLTVPLFKLVEQDPANYQMKGHLIISSFYPLPWMLHEFPNLTYDESDLPDAKDMDAGFLAVSEEHVEEVKQALKEDYFIRSFHLRGGMEQGTLFLNYNKFRDIFPREQPEFRQGMAVPAEAVEAP